MLVELPGEHPLCRDDVQSVWLLRRSKRPRVRQPLGAAWSPPWSFPSAHRYPPGPGCNYPVPGQHALTSVAAVTVAAVTAVTTAVAAAAATAAAVTVAVAAAVTMTAAVTATVTAAAVAAAAAAAVVTAVSTATAKTVAAAQTRLWGPPEAPVYPGIAAVTMAAESSCPPEAVPPQTVSSGAPK